VIHDKYASIMAFFEVEGAVRAFGFAVPLDTTI
jgi:hypothetical protein